MVAPFTASIRPGLNASTTQINVRTGPGTDFDVAFKADVGLSGLDVIDVQPDDEGTRLRGKTYQWLQLAFPDGQRGWVRDDLVDVFGDGTAFGYGVVTTHRFAFELTRAFSNPEHRRRVSGPLEPGITPDTTTDDIPSDLERTVKVAFGITAAFEGSGYGSYQTYDRGIISYGRFQFTLQSGNLVAVIQRYIETAPDQPAAQTLQQRYLEALNARDIALRGDAELRQLLQTAAQDPAMQAAQDAIAFERFWSVVYDLSIQPRNIRMPLLQAMCFDIGIQHGPRHNLYARAEEALGVPIKSRIGENGIDEPTFALEVATIRRNILYRIAEEQNLPGVKRRADFWTQLIGREDWNLAGDEDGIIVVFGKRVQVG